ncbi:hypothetical protein D9M68_345000 [compost metagenome]
MAALAGHELGADPVFRPALGIFLDDDRIGTGRQGCSGEDADGLSRPHLSLEAMAGSRLADHNKFRANGLDILMANRIAVHCRIVEGGMSDECRDILGKDAADSVVKIDTLCQWSRGCAVENSVERIFDGQQRHDFSSLRAESRRTDRRTC